MNHKFEHIEEIKSILKLVLPSQDYFKLESYYTDPVLDLEELRGLYKEFKTVQVVDNIGNEHTLPIILNQLDTNEFHFVVTTQKLKLKLKRKSKNYPNGVFISLFECYSALARYNDVISEYVRITLFDAQMEHYWNIVISGLDEAQEAVYDKLSFSRDHDNLQEKYMIIIGAFDIPCELTNQIDLDSKDKLYPLAGWDLKTEGRNVSRVNLDWINGTYSITGYPTND